MNTVTAQSPAIVLCRMSHMVIVTPGLIVRYIAHLYRGKTNEVSVGQSVGSRRVATNATPKFAAPSITAAPIICGPTMYMT